MNPGNPYARQDQTHYHQTRRGDENVSATAPRNTGTEHATPILTRGGSQPTHASAHSTNCVAGLNRGPDTSPALAPSPVSTREKEVKFDLHPQEQVISPNPSPSPSHRERERDRQHERRDDSDSEDERRDSNRDGDGDDRTPHRRRRADERSNASQGSGPDRKRHRRAEDPDSDTDSTVELPPRFDERGRRKEDDPAAETLERVLQGLFR
jgi:hypothetical protein